MEDTGYVQKLIALYPITTRAELADALHVKERTLERHITILRRKGVLPRVKSPGCDRGGMTTVTGSHGPDVSTKKHTRNSKGAA